MVRRIARGFRRGQTLLTREPDISTRYCGCRVGGAEPPTAVTTHAAVRAFPDAAAVLAVNTWSGCSIGLIAGIVGLAHPGTVHLLDRLGSARTLERGSGAEADAMYWLAAGDMDGEGYEDVVAAASLAQPLGSPRHAEVQAALALTRVAFGDHPGAEERLSRVEGEAPGDPF